MPTRSSRSMAKASRPRPRSPKATISKMRTWSARSPRRTTKTSRSTPPSSPATTHLFAQNDTTSGSTLGLPPQNYMPPSTTDQSDQTAGANGARHANAAADFDRRHGVRRRELRQPARQRRTGRRERHADAVRIQRHELRLDRRDHDDRRQRQLSSSNSCCRARIRSKKPCRPTTSPKAPRRAPSPARPTARVTSSTVISQIAVLGGDNSVSNNFALVQPASISGNVADCLADKPLSGVTVELLNSSGAVVANHDAPTARATINSPACNRMRPTASSRFCRPAT